MELINYLFRNITFPHMRAVVNSLILIKFTCDTGGAFIAFEQMQNEERNGSVSATIWDLSYETLGGGIPTPAECRDLFTKHGFTDITITFTQEWNEVDITYARKTPKVQNKM